MHELGIVVHITKSVLSIAAEHNLSEVDAVTLQIGEVSGIVPEFLTDCWKYYRNKNDLLKESELKIEMLPAITYCEDCQKEYETVKFGRICPHCSSEHTYLLKGNECMIKELEAC